MTRIRFAVLTISDRSASGERADLSGPALASAVQAKGWEVIRQDVVPDDRTIISQSLAAWSDEAEFDVILTTGGTGFAPRDITPEATLQIIDREAPGLAESMRTASAARSPHAMLSRARAGIRGKVLIVNLPGSPRAAVENFDTIAPALAHAVQLLRQDPEAEAGHKLAGV